MPLPFIKIQWYTTPVQFFFQNDQFLKSFQVILSFSCRMNGCGEIPLFGKKNLTATGVLRKNIWFSLLMPKIKFETPPQGKNALVFIF